MSTCADGEEVVASRLCQACGLDKCATAFAVQTNGKLSLDCLACREANSPAFVQCTACGETKSSREGFYFRRGRPASKCKACHAKSSSAWRVNNPEKAQAIIRRSFDKHKEKYYRNGAAKRAGVSVETLSQLEARQGGLCAVCGEPETEVMSKTGRVKKLAVDHNHQTGSVRGLCCRRCNNFILAMIEREGVEKARRIFERAVSYLTANGGVKP